MGKRCAPRDAGFGHLQLLDGQVRRQAGRVQAGAVLLRGARVHQRGRDLRRRRLVLAGPHHPQHLHHTRRPAMSVLSSQLDARSQAQHTWTHTLCKSCICKPVKVDAVVKGGTGCTRTQVAPVAGKTPLFDCI